LPNPPVLWDIESDPVLASTKLLAEAWDAAGLYQVGSFVGDSWREWNGRFRDDVRDYFRCAPGSIRRIADRMIGSPEIYGHKQREVEQSINFVTCHDGFTLNDLVSYNDKHNEANGEGNRDGASDNRSWNCGVEGPTDDPLIEQMRNRQVKNFLAATMLSLGVPMITMGDEVRRTQFGNNNAYCQDNELSWLDWTLLDKHADVHRFFSLLCARRVLRTSEANRTGASLSEMLAQSNHSWHGPKINQPDWSDHSFSLALNVELRHEAMFIHLMLNSYWEPVEFELPVSTVGSLAAVDRHRTRLTERHRTVGRGLADCWNHLSRRSTLGRPVVCRERLVMKVLLLNAGSSSLKASLVESNEGHCSRASVGGLGRRPNTLSVYRSHRNAGRRRASLEITWRGGATVCFEDLTSVQPAALPDPAELAAVGHRMVHGGDFTSSVGITAEVRTRIACTGSTGSPAQPAKPRDVGSGRGAITTGAPRRRL
jgi:hypothetical protein